MQIRNTSQSASFKLNPAKVGKLAEYVDMQGWTALSLPKPHEKYN